jgi:sec-independent protein translocase protein TatB|tara:strand:- start:11783 stop:12013 length:231 start_codon:yes stop_codon:yes gene_type:complete
MPQIGWFELLILVVISILVIGPKDFPIVLKKIGTWIRTTKKYFSDIQSNVAQITNIDEDKIESLKDEKNKEKDEKK